MAPPKIVMYLDIVSPFAYMAFKLLTTSPVFKTCNISFIPVFLGGIMKSTGNSPPLSVPTKSIWINIERRRWANLFNIQMPDAPPDGFPVLTLTIQRALTALTTIAPEKLQASSEALYQKYWAERNIERVDKPEGLAKTLNRVLGEDVTRQVMEKSTTDEMKKLLNRRSADAVSNGAFGLPWFIATNSQGETEMFWGFDHIGQLCVFLGLDKPQHTGGWRAML